MEIKLSQRLKLASRGFDPRGALPGLDAQAAWFRTKFPGGFDDPAWRKDARGERPRGKVSMGIERASVALRAMVEPGSLAARRRDAGDDATLEAFIATLRASRLPLLRPLDELPSAVTPTSSTAWLDALAALLAAGEADRARCFDAWADAHAKPSWAAVTAVPALCDAAGQLFVRPTLLDAQARVLGVTTGRAARPSGAAYVALVGVARALVKELTARKLGPRDLMDVSLFSARALAGAQQQGSGGGGASIP